MAASSSSSIPSMPIDDQKSFKYDVFLSFRGTDTRNNFIGHLYQALQDKGIYTYMDDKRITKGKRISDELLGSIEDSQFYIVVFSKNYASSSWCLDELVKIMECQKKTKHTAYPVFYDVEPTEVRHQTGVVGEAFVKHENNEVAEKWRIALKEAADLAGRELKNTANGNEARFIQMIIEDVSRELNAINFSFDKKLVGIQARVNDIVSSLEIGIDDVRMIGIKGMGGAGKTTLARAVFDYISFQFEGKSFIGNVREVTNNHVSGLKSLQQQMLSDVLYDKDISGDGQNIMKRRLRGRKVLIALDDVDDIEQLEALAGDLDWFKSGSRIIITTRDEQVLQAHGVKLIHKVNLLSQKEAICLFSKYAFRREGPIDKGYENLSEQVVHYASGLPLTIKVLGSQLYHKNKHEWEDAIQRLKTIPLDKTLKILELSYNVLENDLKEIFLDVACILKGCRKDRAIQALESRGFRATIGLSVLQEKSLITVDDNDFVGMHDHIEEMGKNIVRRLHPDMPHKHSRLWKHDEIEHILANDLGLEETRCLRFYAGNVDPYILTKGLGKMKALRCLYVVMENRYGSLEINTFFPCFQDVLGYLCLNCYSFRYLFKTCGPSFPDALEYLSWKYYPFTSLPKTFQANNLVTLEMPESKVVQLWEGGEHKVLDKLRFLDLSHSKSLRTLDLRLTPNLETLNLGDCCDLVELPDGMWTLKYLRSLDLHGSELLEKLPEDLCRSGCLEKLDLSYTKIKHLSDKFCMLKQLKYLDLNLCKLLEKLPEDIGQLECLEDLYLSSTKIQHLPDSICKLEHLNYLRLDNCLMLEKLPEDLGQSGCLEKLDLSFTNVKHLPHSICMLKQLKYINLKGCKLLKKLPDDLGHLECLGYLDLSYTKIKHLPDSICKLKDLMSLILEECLLLKKLPEDLGELECLNYLNLSSTKIKHLPDSICKLKHLNTLDLTNLLLEKLPEDLGRLKCLKKLYVGGTRISQLPQSIHLLKGLRIYGSRRLLHSVGFTSQQIQTPKLENESYVDV